MIFKINSFEIDLKSTETLSTISLEVKKLEEEVNEMYRDKGLDIEFKVGMNRDGVKSFKLIYERYVDVSKYGFAIQTIEIICNHFIN